MHGENYARNLDTARVLEAMAASKGFTPAQLACAWILSRGEDIVPLAGVSRPSRIADKAALDVAFTADELATLERSFAPGAIVGARYPEFVISTMPETTARFWQNVTHCTQSRANVGRPADRMTANLANHLLTNALNAPRRDYWRPMRRAGLSSPALSNN